MDLLMLWWCWCRVCVEFWLGMYVFWVWNWFVVFVVLAGFVLCCVGGMGLVVFWLSVLGFECILFVLVCRLVLCCVLFQWVFLGLVLFEGGLCGELVLGDIWLCVVVWWGGID